MATLIERAGMTAIRLGMDGEKEASQTIRELLEQRRELISALDEINFAASASVCNTDWIANHAKKAIDKCMEAK